MRESEIIRELKLRNPYPQDIFPDCDINIRNFIFHMDRVFAKFGRLVWFNCVNQLADLFLADLGEKRG